MRRLAQYLIDAYRVSDRRACRTVALARQTFRYEPVREKNLPLRLRIREIAMTRVRYGMWRIYVLLRREGWKINHKRVHRLYKLEGLNLRSKRPRRSRTAPAAAHPGDAAAPVMEHGFGGRRPL